MYPSKPRIATNPPDAPTAPFAEEWRRWRSDRNYPERLRFDKLPVPGWPKRGRFSHYDRHRLAVMLPSMRRLIEDIVDGVHYSDAGPMPWSEKSSSAYAYDALAFARHTLAAFLTARSTPVFRVVHAALREWDYNLPANPASARRMLKKIIANVRREQSGTPDAQPDEAGATCRRYPSIAIRVYGRDHRSPSRHGRAASTH